MSDKTTMPVTQEDILLRAKEIHQVWLDRTLAGVLATGEELDMAKQEFAGHQFNRLVSLLPFDMETAIRLIRMSQNLNLTCPDHAAFLPDSYRALYYLSRLDDTSFFRFASKGRICRDMRRKAARSLFLESRGKRVVGTIVDPGHAGGGGGGDGQQPAGIRGDTI